MKHTRHGRLNIRRSGCCCQANGETWQGKAGMRQRVLAQRSRVSPQKGMQSPKGAWILLSTHAASSNHGAVLYCGVQASAVLDGLPDMSEILTRVVVVARVPPAQQSPPVSSSLRFLSGTVKVRALLAHSQPRKALGQRNGIYSHEQYFPELGKPV